MDNYYKVSVRLLSENNDQFGFEVDKKLISLLSKYNYSIIISGIVLLD